jgi:S1-C subfamily serine protease/predicted esterase
MRRKSTHVGELQPKYRLACGLALGFGRGFAFLLSLTWLLCFTPILISQPPAIDELQEKAMRAALEKVAPSVVQIETTGGTDVIDTGPRGQPFRQGVAPTTGLIVSADGYIISSAFNFANKPSFILVAIAGKKERLPAKVVSTDHSRMLTLLKVEATGLPVPTATPRKEIKVGQWSLALGRTWAGIDSPPSMSAGIISAIDRIWGRAVQTDAKVSPVNYGGPLVDITGRVQGILVPAAPREEGETAGYEWYDSGIGFAIPLEDIFAALPRMKETKDLRRGLLGILPKDGDIYTSAPVIGTVMPQSAAAVAGFKPGDVITEVEGVRVQRQAQVLHLLGRKYEGDSVSVKVKRGGQELTFANLKMTGLLTAFAHPYIGILPLRDDPELGLEIRYVFPQSPADVAGLKPGDRILTLGADKETPKPFAGREGLLELLNLHMPGDEVKMEVRRKGVKDKLDTVTLKLSELPGSVPGELPEPASLKKALTPKKTVGPKPPMQPKKEEAKKEEPKKDPKNVETGFFERTNVARDHHYWLYVPEDYDPNISYGLVVWLHPAGKGTEKEIKKVANTWDKICQDMHLILVCPQAQNETGWLRNEGGFITEVIQDLISTYTIDRQRIMTHGWASGGQQAFYLGFQNRELIHGVATTGAVMSGPVPDSVPNQRLTFFVVAGGKDPIAKAIAETKSKLVDKKLPVVFREIPDMGSQYLDAETLAELARWIDSLDRL